MSDGLSDKQKSDLMKLMFRLEFPTEYEKMRLQQRAKWFKTQLDKMEEVK